MKWRDKTSRLRRAYGHGHASQVHAVLQAPRWMPPPAVTTTANELVGEIHDRMPWSFRRNPTIAGSARSIPIHATCLCRTLPDQ